ncbi:MAG: iron ABC transporter permease [Candidatus Omnitrophota bacterium]
MRIKISTFLIICVLILIVVSVLSLVLGSVNFTLNKEILKLRFFRIVLAIIAGGGLALAGLILQALLRNPLAEPYVLGVSSGSGLGAVIGLLFFERMIFANSFGFIGGILTIILVSELAKVNKRTSSENMIIAGIIVNALFSSILMFFVSNSFSPKIHSVIWWLLGNLQVYKLSNVIIPGIILLAGLFITQFYSKELNAMSLGEEEALHLGVNVEVVKKILLITATLVTSIIVSMCGIIGFVGLMIPHMARRLIGPDHRKLVPASVLMGGIFLLICDLISRTIISPREIPVGVITAFIGVPFFIYILRRTRKVYFK